ncbi:heme exporter protein CcmB [Wolbachia endosymbiont of Chironomus riparius]|uniref:heme exporter protein CcmB n=1 Tax=Wolbachia endosymbiont of Chironomus riparius TaxID=2883238 RepID=UPI00209DA74D|nr:heme exporter protein CcmB [Wolbachia endosymbiont of Chironomus riparius]
MIYIFRRIITDLSYIVCLFIIMLSLSLFILEKHDKQELILALIWICTTFVLQISTSNLFTSDYHEGILEQIFIQPISSRFIIFCKIFTHWILFGLPISVVSFIFIEALYNSIEYSIKVGLSLLINTLMIINISATGHSLTIGKSVAASAISQILVLPMIMPTFVYFELLIKSEYLPLNIQVLSMTTLVFIVLIANSTIATYVALKFAIEQD